MKSKLLIFLLPLFWHVTFAQTYTVKGVVKDKFTGEKLAGAYVISEGKATACDEKGRFSISLTSINVSIVFTYLGYDSNLVDVKKLSFTNDVGNLNVFLTPIQKQLQQVVISAGKFDQHIEEVSVSMEVLRPDLIERTNTTRLDQTLDQLPGVNVVNGQINIRGGSGFSYGAGSRVALMVDGLPLMSGDAGDIKWDALPIENIEQVEVIKGASSALFGSGALGGVINLRTAVPQKKPVTKIRVFSGVTDDAPDKKFQYWKTNPMQYGASVFHSRKIGAYELSAGVYYLSDDGISQYTVHR